MKRDERKIAPRFAVYTRVSKDFNSLDNQRGARKDPRSDPSEVPREAQAVQEARP